MTVASVLIALTMVWVVYEDMRTMTVPDTIPVFLILFAYISGMLGIWNMTSICLGFIIGGGLMLIVFFLGPLGVADIKLMAALGAWFGIRILDILLLSFMLGSLIGTIYFLKYRDSKKEIPFSPAIAVSVLIFWFTDITFVTG